MAEGLELLFQRIIAVPHATKAVLKLSTKVTARLGLVFESLLEAVLGNLRVITAFANAHNFVLGHIGQLHAFQQEFVESVVSDEVRIC